MSKEGQILRGKSYYKFRDIDGNLPLNLSSNVSIMKDVNAYLASIKPIEIKETSKKKKGE